MKDILANTKYGFKSFEKSDVVLDLTPMRIPMWIVWTILVVVGGSILLLPLPFKILSLILLVVFL